MPIIAEDPAYLIRDNQFWYGDCTFVDLIRDRQQISLHIAGLGKRTLQHAAIGVNGRPTRSYKLPSDKDRRWWEEHRGEHVRVELLAIDDGVSFADPDNGVMPAAIRDVLCIGLDIAWFGGGVADWTSRFDALVSICIDPDGSLDDFRFKRIPLPDRDPYAKAMLSALESLIMDNPRKKVLLALDAPIQAVRRPNLPEFRPPCLRPGEVERRACEEVLGSARMRIDQAVGGSNGWHPNIQPGAPLASRVHALVTALQGKGFSLWLPERHEVKRLVIECFPAEAIWAMKRLGGYRDELTVDCAKAYKRQQRRRLSAVQVEFLMHSALDGFASYVDNWDRIVASAIDSLLADVTWQVEGCYRGGKFLDDAVDSVICLAAALGYANGNAHVWFDEQCPEDGHIIGPGLPDPIMLPWQSAKWI